MTIKELIEKHAARFNYTALCGDECGCRIDDLSSCEHIDLSNCHFGHWHTCGCGQKFASPNRDDTLCPACKERYGDIDDFARQGTIAWADVPDAAEWQRNIRRGK